MLYHGGHDGLLHQVILDLQQLLRQYWITPLSLIVLSNCLIIIVSSPSANRPGLRATRWFTHTVSNQGAGCETPRLRFLSWLSVNICSLMSHLAELLMLTPSKYRSARMCVCVSVCFWPGFVCRYFRKKKFWFYKCGYLHLLLIKLFPFSWAHCNFKWYDSLWDFIFF